MIASFSHYEKGERLPTNGMIDSLLSFFLPRLNYLCLIDQPHPVSDSVDPVCEIYKERKLEKKFIFSKYLYLPIFLLCRLPSKNQTRISYKLRDFISVIVTPLILRKKFDLFIGLESINTLAGIFLRKLGIVKTVVYYVSDYSPIRFGQTLFNHLYLWLDQYCVSHADFTWDVSPYIKTGRIEAGLKPRLLKKVIHVPNGLFKSQIKPLPITNRLRDSLVYMGILDPEKGIEMILKSFKLIQNKKRKTTLHIIGGTNKQMRKLKKYANNLGIKDGLKFYGFVPPDEKMSKIINKCYLGIAAYTKKNASQNLYGDSGKIRQYLGCGLPIVATTIQWYTKEAIELGAGVSVEENAESLANGVLALLNDQKKYKKCSEVAKKLGSQNTWEKSYLQAFNLMAKLQ